MTHAFNTSVPNVARVYDVLLGGKNGYAADRAAAAQIMKLVPQAMAVARQNRLFLHRTVRYLVEEAGIRQFIDIGSGLPTMQNVHEIAQKASPGARVAYVDHDTVVTSHARALLATSERVAVAEADLRRPRDILDNPELRKVIDLRKPAAILLVAIMHFIKDEEQPHLIVDTLKTAVMPGSYLVMSHAASAPLGGDQADGVREVYAASESGGVTPRSYPQVKRFFDGFNLIDPGLVDIGAWRPGPGSQPMDPPLFHGGVAVKP
jgi:hypothetical protein